MNEPTEPETANIIGRIPDKRREVLARELIIAAHLTGKTSGEEMLMQGLLRLLDQERSTVAKLNGELAAMTAERNRLLPGCCFQLDEVRKERDAAVRGREEAVAALFELAAMVRGECPSLLNEDSGGDVKLSMEIDRITQAPAAKAIHTCKFFRQYDDGYLFFEYCVDCQKRRDPPATDTAAKGDGHE
jgi:hypothetical protein